MMFYLDSSSNANKNAAFAWFDLAKGKSGQPSVQSVFVVARDGTELLGLRRRTIVVRAGELRIDTL